MKDLPLASSVAIGVVAYLALRFGVEYLQGVTSGDPVSGWTVLLTPAPMLVNLLPGFLSGWLCRRAMVAGFLVGLLGSAIFSVVSDSAGNYFSGGQGLLLPSWFLAQCVTIGIYGAVGGAAARLLRSN